MALSQLRPAYYYALQRYARALKQRNEVLKAALSSPSLMATIDSWDEQLAAAGAELMRHRRAYIEQLSAVAAETHLHIADGREKLSVRYQPNVSAGDDVQSILDALLAARETDVRRLTTSVGAHRDEVLLTIDGREVRSFGSQGQQRTAALSLRLSELSVMRDEMGEWPVLMLDDVMSELDPHRRRQLIARLEGIQTIVTCTDMDDLAGAEIGAAWRVHGAELERVK
jgi:DNA replication and repair protein RecF